MDFTVILKGGFMGFALSLGVLVLVFYIVGAFVKVSSKNFVRVFILAGVASFIAVYVLLHYRIRVAAPSPDAALFLAGCVGGWLAGIVSGLTQMKSLLLRLRG